MWKSSTRLVVKLTVTFCSLHVVLFCYWVFLQSQSHVIKNKFIFWLNRNVYSYFLIYWLPGFIFQMYSTNFTKWVSLRNWPTTKTVYSRWTQICSLWILTAQVERDSCRKMYKFTNHLSNAKLVLVCTNSNLIWLSELY